MLKRFLLHFPALICSVFVIRFRQLIYIRWPLGTLDLLSAILNSSKKNPNTKYHWITWLILEAKEVESAHGARLGHMPTIGSESYCYLQPSSIDCKWESWFLKGKPDDMTRRKMLSRKKRINVFLTLKFRLL